MSDVKSITFEAKGQRWKFVFGTYAVAMVERASGKSWQRYIKRKPDEWGGSEILQCFHAGLSRHHDITEKEAADLIDEMGGEKVGSIVKEGLGIADEGPHPTEKAAQHGKKV